MTHAGEEGTMGDDTNRPRLFQRIRDLPLVGKVADWGMGPYAVSKNTKAAGSRIAGLKATESICPYCAVGCGQIVYTRNGELVDIEGNPRSPINQGTLCPKGSASRQLIQQPGRLTKVKYRRPGGTEWEELELEQAMDMIAERVIEARENGWGGGDSDGWRRARRAGRRPTGTAGASTARSASPTSAAPRSTTRRTTSSRSCSRRWARCRSRTRPAYDTAPPCPVWARRSGAAAPATSSRTSRTPIASGSRGPRWRR